MSTNVDYKFISINDKGTTTDVKLRYFNGTLSGSYLRDSVLEAVTETHSGSKTYQELVDYYNTALATKGTAIPEQVITNYILKQDYDNLMTENSELLLKE